MNITLTSMERAATMEEALALYQQGLTFSEAAERTGLQIEAIMEAVTARTGEAGLEQFLASCRQIAERETDPGFLLLGEMAVRRARQAR